jgi:hypothetical protein
MLIQGPGGKSQQIAGASILAWKASIATLVEHDGGVRRKSISLWNGPDKSATRISNEPSSRLVLPLRAESVFARCWALPHSIDPTEDIIRILCNT